MSESAEPPSVPEPPRAEAPPSAPPAAAEAAAAPGDKPASPDEDRRLGPAHALTMQRLEAAGFDEPEPSHR